MVIHLDANENTLTNLTPTKVVRKGAINYYRIKLSCSPDWDGLSKVVMIKNPDEDHFESAHMLLSNLALIPCKSIEKAANELGDVSITVVGVAYAGELDMENGNVVKTRIVTNAVTLNVAPPEYLGDAFEGENSIPIEVAIEQMGEYAKLIENYKAYIAAIEVEVKGVLEKLEGQKEQLFKDFEKEYLDAEGVPKDSRGFLEGSETRWKNNRWGCYGRAEADRMEKYIAAEEKNSVWTEYDPQQSYVRGNKICFNGGSYLCTAPAGTTLTGAPPGVSDFWLLIAARGEDGHGDLTGPGAGRAKKGNLAVFADDGKTVADGGAAIEDIRYRHPYEPGFKHIPPGGSEGQLLGWRGDGAAMWTSFEAITGVSPEELKQAVENFKAVLNGDLIKY